MSSELSRVTETLPATLVGDKTDLATAVDESRSRSEVEGAILVAKKYPRNEESSYGAITRSCRRPSFAERATYAFPRSGKTITGPSIYFAKEFARVWGNIQYGADVIHEDDERRVLRAWAWDVQTNVRVTQDATFMKLHQRKQKDGSTQWVVPDERDTRELNNRQASLAVRGCILSLLPADMIADALAIAHQTESSNVSADPDAKRKGAIASFAAIGIDAAQLAAYLGNPVGQATTEQIVDLQRIRRELGENNAKWSDFHRPATPTASAGSGPQTVSTADLLQPKGGIEDNPHRSRGKSEPKTASPTPPQAVASFVPGPGHSLFVPGPGHYPPEDDKK